MGKQEQGEKCMDDPQSIIISCATHRNFLFMGTKGGEYDDEVR
jgi:hypothetical protein